MFHNLRLAVMLAATPILALGLVASPQNDDPGCAKPVAESRYNQQLFRSLMRRNDKTADKFLKAYNVSRVSALEVRPVSNPTMCKRAAVAYGQAVNQSKPAHKVHILRVGKRFIVMDPEFVVDNHHRAVTFDSTFTTAIALVAEE